MKVALTGGGTGGHILPALVVLDALRAGELGGVEARFFGPDDRGERRSLGGQPVDFEAIPAAAIRGRGPLAAVRNALHLARGIVVATAKLRRFRPDVVFSTGGYASFPCCVAARLLRRPLVVYLPDVEPGWAVKAERRLATRIATTTDSALNSLPAAKTVVTGYPVRPQFFAMSRADARAALGLADGETVVLVAGASQGAHAINQAVFRGLRSLIEEVIVIHITGQADYEEAAGYAEALGEGLVNRYHVAKFRDDLPIVMLAADLAVMRAGASTLGELPAAGLPAILVPGAYAGGHQRANARWLEERGAATVLDEENLRGLADAVLNLLEDEPRLQAMRAAAQALARPQAANDIASVCSEVARR